MSSKEEILLALLSMGFDYEKCSVVLDQGVKNVEEAIQKLLNPIPDPNPPKCQQLESGKKGECSKTSSASSSSASSLEQGESSKVKSRFERQRKEQAEFERKEARNLELVKRKQKQEERKTKENVLKEIEDDRKRHKRNEENGGKSAEDENGKNKVSEKEEYEKRERELAWKKIQMEKKAERQRVLQGVHQDKLNRKQKVGTKVEEKVHVEAETTSSGVKKTSSSCRIQVVFPCGPNKSFTLPVDTKLQQLFDLCVPAGDEGKGNYSFLQTFPKKTYAITESESTLQDLGLCPSAKLLLKQSADEVRSPDAASQAEGEHMSLESSPPSEPKASPMELGNDDQNNTDRVENQVSSTNDNLDSSEVPNAEAPIVAPVSIDIETQHQNRRLHSRLLHGDFFNIIQDIDNVDLDIESHKEPPLHSARARLFQEAFEKRLIGNVDSQNHTIRKRKMLSLQALVAKFITTHMLKKEPRIVEFMSLLNPKAANVIVKTLKSIDKLTVDTLNMLKPCKIQEINLDDCRLTSLDVILALKNHHSLKRISLKSVNCIADRAVETILKNSPNINYLNISQCEAVVGSFLINKIGLTRLKTLILDQDKIKNEYLKSFLRMQPAKQLNQLSLNYCPVTNEAFDMVEEYPSLKILSINNTMVTCLKFLSLLPNLVGLGVKSLKIKNEDISLVAPLNNLKFLDLQGTNISYEGLQHIKHKNLTHFTFPDRLCVDNKCLTVIEDFELSSLDFSDYIHLDDGCMRSICMISHLSILSMANTKITDEGALEMKKLTNLEGLDISRTCVTSNISSIFSNLRYLATLNVSRTKVTNEFLSCLNCCLALSKLNISNTAVNDEGIRVLNLPKLSVIIADGTGLTKRGVQFVQKNCLMLKLVRNSQNDVNFSRDLNDPVD